MTGILFYYTLHLGDNALILSHRNSEWCSHAPEMEQDVAITNIALDLLGQARLFYQYAAQLYPKASVTFPFSILPTEEPTEDTLAYFRDSRDFKNCLLVELPNNDWAHTILRQFFFSNYQYHFYLLLQQSSNQQLAAIATKALKEVAYHVRWSSDWVIRLGDGTEESHNRMNLAINNLTPYVEELFTNAYYETALFEQQIAVDVTQLKESWLQQTQKVFDEATLHFSFNAFAQSGGKNGIHTEHLGYLLAEMQSVQRAYPNCNW